VVETGVLPLIVTVEGEKEQLRVEGASQVSAAGLLMPSVPVMVAIAVPLPPGVMDREVLSRVPL
jgi:hypothetical protein